MNDNDLKLLWRIAVAITGAFVLTGFTIDNYAVMLGGLGPVVFCAIFSGAIKVERYLDRIENKDRV